MNYLPRISLLLIAASFCAQADDDIVAPSPDEQTVPVAAPDEPSVTASSDSVDAAVPEDASDEEQLAEQYGRYLQLMSDHTYDEADSVAKRVVELTLRVRGPGSTDYSKALINLAIVQHYNNQYDAAEQNFATAIEIIESNEDRLNGQLVNPLKGLGASQLDAGKPELADETFRRAVHVTHVNNGPHNLEQIEILESLAETSLRLGMIAEARDIQERIYSINAHAYSEDSMEFVPSLLRRADWQHRAGFINDERVSLRRAVRIIEDQLGDDDLQLVDPLIRLGKSYFFMDTTNTQTGLQSTLTSGEIFFKRALRIATENPDADWQTVARSSLALGDFYTYDGNWPRARTAYQESWNFLSGSDDRLEFRRENLERPTLLRERALPQYVSSPGEGSTPATGEAFLHGSITVAFEVSTSGRTANLRIIEAQPVTFPSMQRAIQREMRSRLYRPRFEDAEPVASDELLLVHRFFYTQVDLDEVEKATVDADAETEET